MLFNCSMVSTATHKPIQEVQNGCNNKDLAFPERHTIKATTNLLGFLWTHFTLYMPHVTTHK